MKLHNIERIGTLIHIVVVTILVCFAVYTAIVHSRSKRMYSTDYADEKIRSYVEYAMSQDDASERLLVEYSRLRDSCLGYVDNTLLVSRACIYTVAASLIWSLISRTLIKQRFSMKKAE